MSLRSIDKNLFEDVPVFILSEEVPPYLSNRINFIQVESYQDALATACNIADEILWMNDDIFLLQPHTWDDFRTWVCNGREVTASYIVGLMEADNKWRVRLGKLLSKLKLMGKTTFNFSTHTPYLYDTSKLAEILIKFNFGYKTAVETAYGNYFQVPTRPISKLSRHHEAQLPMDCSCYEIMNYDDKGANPHTRGFLLGMFPAPSKYEFHRSNLTKTIMTSIK